VERKSKGDRMKTKREVKGKIQEERKERRKQSETRGAEGTELYTE
jgi:hypothetical protein